jgi:hypothetical protein
MCRDLTNSARRRVGSEPPAAARTSVYQFALVAIKNPIFSTSCVIVCRGATVWHALCINYHRGVATPSKQALTFLTD